MCLLKGNDHFIFFPQKQLPVKRILHRDRVTPQRTFAEAILGQKVTCDGTSDTLDLARVTRTPLKDPTLSHLNPSEQCDVSSEMTDVTEYTISELSFNISKSKVNRVIGFALCYHLVGGQLSNVVLLLIVGHHRQRVRCVCVCVCVCVCYCGAPTCEELCTETESPLVRLTELRNVITQLSLSGCTMMLQYIDVHSSL